MSVQGEDPVICFKVSCLVKEDIPTFIVPTRMTSSLTLGRFAADIVERCNKKLQSAGIAKGAGKGSAGLIALADISSVEIAQPSIKEGTARELSPLLLDLIVNEQDPLRYFIPSDVILGGEHLSVILHPVELHGRASRGRQPISSNASDNSSDGGDGASSRKSPVTPAMVQGFVPKPPKRLDADALTEDSNDTVPISSTSFRSRRVKRYTESTESNSNPTPLASESACRSPLAKRPPSTDPVRPQSPSPIAVASLSTEARGSLSPYSPPARLQCNVPHEADNGEEPPRPRTVSRFHSLVSSAAEFAAHETIRLSRQTAEQLEPNSHLDVSAVEKLEELRTRYKEIRFALCTEERKSRRMLRTQFLVPFGDAPREVAENAEAEPEPDVALIPAAEMANRRNILTDEAESRQRMERELFIEWKRCLLRRETHFNKEERELIVQEGLQRTSIEEQFTRKLCMYCKTYEQGLKRLQSIV